MYYYYYNKYFAYFVLNTKNIYVNPVVRARKIGASIHFFYLRLDYYERGIEKKGCKKA